MNARGLMLLAVVVLSTVAGAETYTWTGAQDAYWTNAANWTVGGVTATKCPGVCSNEIYDANGENVSGWETSVHLADLAEFSSVAPGAATTIDLDGFFCVSSVVFRAGCARITLGSDSNQVFALEALGNSQAKSGRFTVEASAHPPVFVAGFSCGATCKDLGGDTVYHTLVNNSNEEVVFGTMGYSRFFKPNNGSPHVKMYFEGTGDFRFDGRVRGILEYGATKTLWENMYFYFVTSGKVTFSTPLFGRGVVGTVQDDASNRGLLSIMMSGTPFVEILEGCRVATSDWNTPTLYFSQNGEIGGKGTLQLETQEKNKGINGNHGMVYVAKGKTGIISCAFDLHDCGGVSRAKSLLNLKFAGDGNANGTLMMNTLTNRHEGAVWFYGAPVNYRASTVANFGTGTEAYFMVNGAFDYGGRGDETFSRACYVAKNNVAAKIRNTGTGTLTISSGFSVTNATYTGASVVLSPETAPIVFTGSVTPFESCQIPLVKEGADTLVLDSSADFSGVSSIRVTAGSLDLSDCGATLSVPVTFDTGDSVLLVPDDRTVTLASLARTDGKSNGTLDIRCNTGRVKIAGMTSASSAPDGVTVNGSPATFDDEGRLLILPPPHDVSLAARGDVVPNDAASVVAIMTDGTGGNDTLAAAETGVQALYHVASADATIEIGEGRSLTTGLLDMYGLSGNLSVGTADDAGTLAGASGTLLLANRNPSRSLTVNAAVAAGTDVRMEGNVQGRVTLAGGSTGEITVNQTDGALVLTGERAFHLDGGVVGTNVTDALEASLVVDGAKDVVLGATPFHVGGALTRVSSQKSTGRMIVTNSLVRNARIETKTFAAHSTNDALCVGLNGDAVLEIRDGAVITNRLIIGGLYYWENSKQDSNSHGAVIQTGGEMAVLGDTGVGEGSTIGTQSGNGYYELRGGRLVWMGSLSVSHYGTGAGSFLQLGGTSVFTNAFGSSSKPAIGPNAGANGGSGVMRFAGGRAEIHASVRLCGGATNGGRSVMTVEGDADVDAFDNFVSLAGVHTTHGNFSYYKQGDLALVGGVLRATGFATGYSSSCPDYPQFYSVGFNGGTFRTSASSMDVSKGTTSTYYQNMTNFVVYAGGATVDTDGKTGNNSSVPFRGAWGRGVKSFSLADMSDKRFIAAPYIIIKGDGIGATAVVDFDSFSGKVTGVRVLTPGVGYTWAKALLYRDTGDTYIEGVDCVLADNSSIGDFTKKGEGDFTLNAANTWGGDTILRGGVLRLGVDGALPAGSRVVCDGGRLAVADGVTLPAEMTFSVPNYDGTNSVTLLEFEGAVPASLPEITCEGIPSTINKVILSGKKLNLTPVRGTVLIFR